LQNSDNKLVMHQKYSIWEGSLVTPTAVCKFTMEISLSWTKCLIISACYWQKVKFLSWFCVIDENQRIIIFVVIVIMTKINVIWSSL